MFRGQELRRSLTFGPRKSFWVGGSQFKLPKKEKNLVTFCSIVAKTQIDYLLLRKDDKGLSKDCKVMSSRIL